MPPPPPPLARALVCLSLAAAIGCGRGHERRLEDAGAPDAGLDAGPDITSCDHAFDASPGASCPEWLTCTIGDLFCARRHASCPDGHLVFDETDRWVGPEGAACADTGEVDLAGISPSGDLTLGSGVASFSHAFAVFAGLIFFEGDDVTACGLPRLHVPLAPIDLDSYVGAHDVTAHLALEAGPVELTGTATVLSEDRLDDSRVVLTGELDLAGAGSEITGPFRVVECPDLDRGGP